MPANGRPTEMDDSLRRPDFLTFVRRFLANPGRIGAIAPSGPSLARAICKEISADLGPVVELGPGTGVFTQAMLDKGVPERDLTLFEADADFAALLRRRFPAARIVNADIAELWRRGEMRDIEAAAIVSGLPLLSIRHDDVKSILSFAFSRLRRGGTIYQFSYRPLSPVPADIMRDLGISARLSHGVVRNLPPAFVFRLTMADAAYDRLRGAA